MAAAKTESVPLAGEQDIVLARQAVRRAAQEVGFSIVDQTKIITPPANWLRVAVVYGGGGTMNGSCSLKRPARPCA